MRDEGFEVSDSDSDSTELGEEDEQELEKVSDVLRDKIERMKRGRRKKNTKKTFRSDDVFVVDKDVMLKAPGLKGLLSVTDDEVGTKESGSAVDSQPVAASQEANWDW